jgi:predicted small secreted protein
MIKTTVCALIILCTALSLSACSTIEGVGKDMQKAGDWIEEKAKE